MNLGEIFHRTTDNYCYPLNADELVINIRTGYDIEKISIIYGDPFESGILGGNWRFHGETREIHSSKKLSHHILWTIMLKPAFKRCKYYFYLQTKEEGYYYLEDGFYTEDELYQEEHVLQCFTFPWMNAADINVTPNWVKDTVWYQIFPERFCNGDSSNDPANVQPWKSRPVTMEEYYGGDLKGIHSKLDYLFSLGINGIYLTPVFESPSSHKYNITDFKKIDPHFGTNEDMKHLVQSAHQKGLRIMLDGVFNHCGTDFFPWTDVLKNGLESPYFSWFMINTWPFKEAGGSPKDGEFYSFAFTPHMPKLNTNNSKVIEYFVGIVEFWIREFDIDGLRIDVANEISHLFCKELRKKVKALKPDFYLLGEIWHDSISWLQGDEFDAVMNYPLSVSIHNFWLNKDKTKTDFEHSINANYAMYMQQTNDVNFNLLDSHDTNRLIHKVSGDMDIFYQQLTILFTMPGTPCIYYGSEIAMEGSYDPDCRRCMPWDDIEAGQYDMEMAHMKALIQLYRNEDAFRSNELCFLNEIDIPRVIEYTKASDGKRIKIILNCSDEPILKIHPANILYARKFSPYLLSPKGILIYRMD